MTAKPLVPWIGGKRKLAEHILPLFPEHQCYVEPFCGAAALFFLKEPSPVEVLNDINLDLITLYRVVKHHSTELHRQFKWVLTSRDEWERLQRVPPDTLTDIQRAARFLYLQKLAFGGRVDGQSFGTATTSRPRFNAETLEDDLKIAKARLTNTYLEHLPWADVITRYDRPHTLIYCDPPYWETEGYGVDFAYHNYTRLAEVMGSAGGVVIVSINDHPEMREVFRDFHLVEVDYEYQVGGAGNRMLCRELIYGNWPGGVPIPVAQQNGLF